MFSFAANKVQVSENPRHPKKKLVTFMTSRGQSCWASVSFFSCLYVC